MINSCLLLGILIVLNASNSFSTTTTENLLIIEANDEVPQHEDINSTVPTIYEMFIKSKISNRFATTVVTSKVINTANTSQEAAFLVILPENALISAFEMEMDGSSYTAHIVENDNARSKYNSALFNRLGIRYAFPSDLGTNIFKIYVTMKPSSKAAFYLNYEELLKRKNKRYEQIINIHPGQLVEDLNVELLISESKKIKNLKIQSLRSIKKIPNENLKLDPGADVKVKDDSSVFVQFSASKEKQQQLALLMNNDDYNGLSAQFTVEFDLEHDNEGEFLTQDCYFAHFFTQPSLPKYVVIMVSKANSMNEGDRFRQQNIAAKSILDQLQEEDVFNFFEYSELHKVWDLDNPMGSIWHQANDTNIIFPKPYPANEKYIKAAKFSLDYMRPNGYSDILSALQTSLKLAETEAQNRIDHMHRETFIVMLTDGIRNTVQVPTPGTPSETIIKEITLLNSGLRKSSISSILLFGSQENENFLQNLTSLNMGVYKHISESGTTASDKLQDFFRNVRSELSNITFDYSSSRLNDITDYYFPVLDNESEVVVAGECGAEKVIHLPRIIANSRTGVVEKRPLIQKPKIDISLLWAYVTVKQLLEKKKISNENLEEINKKILEVALKYSFVTDLTSMVVVNPNEKVVVGSEELHGRIESHVPIEQSPAHEGNETAPQYKELDSPVPTIYQMYIKSRIENRFATTVVTNKLINTANKTEKAAFSVILPKDALVSAFDMEIDGSYYTSYVVDNIEARSQYNSALADGLEVPTAFPSDLGSNIFQIFVNMTPNSKATFNLTYEELMKRNEKGYEQIINIHPGQFIEEVNVEVFISESRKITNLKIPSLHPIKKTPNVTYDSDPEAYIGKIDDSSVVVKFSANMGKQKQLARLLNSNEYNGLSAQFIVQYDIDHDREGELLTRDCYFAHFFTQPSLPKHVVLLVQSAVSMAEEDKLRQQKLVAQNILDQLQDQDVFTLLEFCGAQKVWDLDNPEASTYHYLRNEQNVTFAKPFPASKKYIMQAKQIISNINANGYSDILTALETSLKLVEIERQNHTDDNHRQALIIILTDGKRYGYHTPRQTPESIIEKITSLNSGLKNSSISSILLFGSAENEKFLQDLTGLNMGVYKHINEVSDTVSNKLQNFFENKGSSSELVNITLDYSSSDLKDITDFYFPVLDNESEVVVAGHCGFGKVIHPPRIIANRHNEVVERRPLIQKSQSDISRLWAYVTVKQLLEKRKISNKKLEEINKRILEVSLKYSFVTDVTSMIVVKPNEKVVVGNEELRGTTESHRPAQLNMKSLCNF